MSIWNAIWKSLMSLPIKTPIELFRHEARLEDGKNNSSKIRESVRGPFLWTMTFFIAIWGMCFSKAGATQVEIRQIDAEIEELQDLKRGYEAKALRHEDYAQRLQFEDRAYLEARRHVELAEENRAKARRVQEEIDKLEAKKKALLEKKGISSILDVPYFLEFF